MLSLNLFVSNFKYYIIIIKKIKQKVFLELCPNRFILKTQRANTYIHQNLWIKKDNFSKIFVEVEMSINHLT